MKSIVAIAIALSAVSAFASDKKAEHKADNKAAVAAPAAAATTAAPAKVDCHDPKNKDHADCKKAAH